MSGLLNRASVNSVVALAVLVSLTLVVFGLVIIRPLLVVFHVTVRIIRVMPLNFFIASFSGSLLVDTLLSLNLLDDTLHGLKERFRSPVVTHLHKAGKTYDEKLPLVVVLKGSSSSGNLL